MNEPASTRRAGNSAFAASERLRRRHRAERRFQAACIAALAVAGAFLVVFFGSMIHTGYPAFVQTEVRIEVAYADPEEYAQSIDSEMRPFVSRGYTRGLMGLLEDNPELVGETRTQWVLATAALDQFYKGDATALEGETAARARELIAADRVRYSFNHWLFTHGDSKIPELAGLRSAIIGSLYVLALTLAFAFPVGVMTAIYLEEFAPDNRFTQAIEININNLAAVPSILFGLLGLAIFINFFGVPRSSALAGGLTLGLMTLPIIIISTRAALRAVPDAIREGALAMGATRWQTVRDHVLPMSLPGILTGTIIGLAQAMGETAPLLLIGMIAYIPDAPTSVTEAATVLPAQIFTWASMPEQAYVSRTAAAILVLLAVLIALNAAAVYLRRRFEHRW
ncbi:MAG: phosphate ABC transporter permease PstA [Halofilum sp. (in: g-proteobacteria)]|nr:phosphate ABC transporter permease PstA [Halofilum sp. (in: g-proteobacteria)]